MNIKVKSSLIIMGTFVLGLVIGSIITRSFFAPPKTWEKIRDLRRPPRFMERFERIIQPTESQQQKVQEILHAHFERMHKNSIKFRKQFMVLNDSLRIELDPILTEEQKSRLDEMEKKIREHTHPGFRPGPPSPGEDSFRKPRRRKD